MNYSQKQNIMKARTEGSLTKKFAKLSLPKSVFLFNIFPNEKLLYFKLEGADFCQFFNFQILPVLFLILSHLSSIVTKKDPPK